MNLFLIFLRKAEIDIKFYLVSICILIVAVILGLLAKQISIFFANESKEDETNYPAVTAFNVFPASWVKEIQDCQAAQSINYPKNQKKREKTPFYRTGTRQYKKRGKNKK